MVDKTKNLFMREADVSADNNVIMVGNNVLRNFAQRKRQVDNLNLKSAVAVNAS